MGKKIIILSWRAIPQGLNLAIVLGRAGFEVTYCSNKLPSVFNPTKIDNINIKIIPLINILAKTKLQNIINWIYGFYYSMNKFDIIIGVDNQGYIPAVLVKFIKPHKLIIGYFLEYNSPEEMAKSLATKLTALWGKYCDILIDVEQNRLTLRKKWMGCQGKSFLIKNTPMFSENRKYPRKKNKFGAQLHVLYTGQIGYVNCIEQLVQSVSMCEIPIRLILIGACSASFMEKLEKEYDHLFKIGKIHFVGFVDRKELIKYYEESDVGIVFYTNKNGCNELYCAPNKLYEYISYGLPVICSDNPSLRFVEREGIGIVINIYDIKQITQQFIKMYNDQNILLNMKINCNLLFHSEYNYEKQSLEFVQYLKQMQ
jgi:glycosyltransferase involved in cell wall biosynthesis